MFDDGSYLGMIYETHAIKFNYIVSSTIFYFKDKLLGIAFSASGFE